MDKLGDIEIFVNVVKQKGLAAAGKKLGLSAASITTRINRLESTYGVRLLTRTTRQVSLTDEGADFYQNCLAIMAEVSQAEENLVNRKGQLIGSLKVTATVDIGKQIVAPALAEFISENPNVKAHLHLVDHVVNLIEDEYDLAIRFGDLADNRMVAQKLIDSHRVLFASPLYLSEYGVPEIPEELFSHKLLGMMRDDKALDVWHFEHQGQKTSFQIEPILSTNDGSLIREWAIQGQGIGLKSICDIRTELADGSLVTVLDEYSPGYSSERHEHSSDLFVVYPSKKYLPLRVRKFVELLQLRFNQQSQLVKN